MRACAREHVIGPTLRAPSPLQPLPHQLTRWCHDAAHAPGDAHVDRQLVSPLADGKTAALQKWTTSSCAPG